jgi:hypothetical protein
MKTDFRPHFDMFTALFFYFVLYNFPWYTAAPPIRSRQIQKIFFFFIKGPKLTSTLLHSLWRTNYIPIIEWRQEGGLQLVPELVENEGQDEESPGVGKIVQETENFNIYI